MYIRIFITVHTYNITSEITTMTKLIMCFARLLPSSGPGRGTTRVLTVWDREAGCFSQVAALHSDH